MNTIIRINQASLIVFSVLLATYIITITFVSSISTPAGKQTAEKGAITSLIKMFIFTLGFTGCAVLADVFAYDGKTPENIVAVILNVFAAVSAAVYIKYILKLCVFNMFENARRLQEADKDEAYKIAVLQQVDYFIADYKKNSSEKPDRGENKK